MLIENEVSKRILNKSGNTRINWEFEIEGKMIAPKSMSDLMSHHFQKVSNNDKMSLATDYAVWARYDNMHPMITTAFLNCFSKEITVQTRIRNEHCDRRGLPQFDNL